jgi:hypothetical protein
LKVGFSFHGSWSTNLVAAVSWFAEDILYGLSLLGQLDLPIIIAPS